MRSAIYEGALWHRRLEPAHGFRRRIAMPLLDLAEIEQVAALHPLWSVERANAVSFRRGHFLGDPATGLDTAVRDLVEREAGSRPRGPISVLAHVQTWGWLFNPVALYYCYDPTGTWVEHAVAHVTNTPWKERHAYVLGGPGHHEVPKALHVSPFFGMDQTYRINFDTPADDLGLSISVHEDGVRVFSAGLQLRRRAVSRRSLGRLLWRYPMLTMRVSTGIHTHALRLWRKGATFHPHPSTTDHREVTDARPSCGAARSDQAA